MRPIRLSAPILLAGMVATVPAQQEECLRLERTILLPKVAGRIDHMDADAKGQRLFVAALENGSLEVVDLKSGNWVQSIPGCKHEARLKEGKAAEVDVIRVRLEGHRLNADSENAKLDAEKAKLELARNIGAGSYDWQLTEDLTTLEPPRTINGDPVAMRMEGRLAAQSLLQASSTLKPERANGRPDLDALFGYKRIHGLNTALVGLQLNIPLTQACQCFEILGEVTIAVDPQTTAERGHEMAMKVQQALKAHLPFLARAGVHVHPAGMSKERQPKTEHQPWFR